MTDVRRCQRCGEAASVCVREWQQTAFLGVVPTGHVPRRDFACQRCGAVLRLPAVRARLIIALMAGVPVTITALLGLAGGLVILVTEGNVGALVFGLAASASATGLLVWCAQPWWRARRNPVVPGASLPTIRFDLTEPLRRCRCDATVPSHLVVRDRIGAETHYRCDSCGAVFVIDSLPATVLMSVGGVLVFALGVGLFRTAAGQGTGAAICAGMVGLLGVGAFALAIVRVIARRRHPVTPHGQP